MRIAESDRKQPCNMVTVPFDDTHILDIVEPREVLTVARLFLPNGVTPNSIAVVAQAFQTGETTQKADRYAYCIQRTRHGPSVER